MIVPKSGNTKPYDPDPGTYPLVGEVPAVPFDPENIKFISPKPFESWILNASYDWESPTGDKIVLGQFWDEETQAWVSYPAE